MSQSSKVFTLGWLQVNPISRAYFASHSDELAWLDYEIDVVESGSGRVIGFPVAIKIFQNDLSFWGI